MTVSILVAGEKKISLRGTFDVERGTISLKAKDGRLLDLRLGANGLRGTFGGFPGADATSLGTEKTAFGR